MAPDVRFARGESWGRDEEEDEYDVAVRDDRARRVRKSLREVKYSAEPTLVRIVEGSVPRHSWRSGFGFDVMSRRVVRRDAEPDCWTRVLRRSMGCRRSAEEKPEPRPAARWNAACRVND